MAGTLFHPKDNADEDKWSPARTAGLVVTLSTLLWLAIIWVLASLAA